MRKILLTSLAMSCVTMTCFATQMDHASLSVHSRHSSNILDLTSLLSNNHLYFAVKNPITGTISYSKDPIFIKKKGYFYQGENRLQGFSLPNDLVASACSLTDIQAPENELAPKATGNASLVLNLDANGIAAVTPFDRNNPGTYNYQVAYSIYDQSGKTHVFNTYYIKTTTYGLWEVQMFDDNQSIASGSMNFDTAGNLASSHGIEQITFKPENSNETQTIKYDLHVTQYAASNQLLSVKFDGYPSGDAIEDQVDANGYIYELYTNGVTDMFGKIAIYAR